METPTSTRELIGDDKGEGAREPRRFEREPGEPTDERRDEAVRSRDADTLVAEVMRERGYPVEDFEQQAADVSVDHPTVVEHYRKAHAIQTRSRASTEDLREAMLHYRALFAELLEPPQRERETQEVS